MQNCSFSLSNIMCISIRMFVMQRRCPRADLHALTGGGSETFAGTFQKGLAPAARPPPQNVKFKGRPSRPQFFNLSPSLPHSFHTPPTDLMFAPAKIPSVQVLCARQAPMRQAAASVQSVPAETDELCLPTHQAEQLCAVGGAHTGR